MRHTVRKQLRKYLCIAWAVNTALLLLAIYLTRGTLCWADFEMIGIVSLGTLGFMWQLLDYWQREEAACVKRRTITPS